MRHYFIRGEYKGAATPSFAPIHGIMTIPNGKAFFCPICSEVWALAPIDGKETYVEHVVCEKHEPTPTRPAPGALYLPWDKTWNDDLPVELLEREYLILLKMRVAGYDIDMTHLNGC